MSHDVEILSAARACAREILAAGGPDLTSKTDDELVEVVACLHAERERQVFQAILARKVDVEGVLRALRIQRAERRRLRG